AENLLRPWVARHMRAGKDRRRSYLPGTAILHQPDVPAGGLPMSGDGALPFLLATRAQVLVGLHGLAEHRQARAFFADGLASSFEAYRFTRRNKTAGMDDRSEDGDAALPPELTWYLDHIDRAIPSDGSAVAADAVGHPKVDAVVERTAQLWAVGEKVVLFCFYVETGKALRANLSRRLRTEIATRAADMLGTDGSDEEAVFTELSRIGDRIEEPPLRGEIEQLVRDRLGVGSLTGEEQDQAVAIVRRFLRTPSFLARFVTLPAVGSLSVDLRGPIMESLERPDGSGSSMADKIARFGGSLLEMVDAERLEVLESLTTVTTGDIHDRSFDPGEVRSASDPYLPNVRLANGSVPPARRRTLMLGFNSPFFPEVLIASAVMAEGVDLHLECRHVIHHDLDWSPSTLEQRTGRLDRIASKAERISEPIVIYEPYLAGMYDEKVYRVVKDRDRWFNVVMGEQIDTSEWATERAAERVPLPASLAASLTFDLSVVGPNSGVTAEP
ncbi:MAG TPA: helicase-related protein, partial [Nocardioides sp.]